MNPTLSNKLVIRLGRAEAEYERLYRRHRRLRRLCVLLIASLVFMSCLIARGDVRGVRTLDGFVACLAGPDVYLHDECWFLYDLDGSGEWPTGATVDLSDYAVLQRFPF